MGTGWEEFRDAGCLESVLHEAKCCSQPCPPCSHHHRIVGVVYHRVATDELRGGEERGKRGGRGREGRKREREGEREGGREGEGNEKSWKEEGGKGGFNKGKKKGVRGGDKEREEGTEEGRDKILTQLSGL